MDRVIVFIDAFFPNHSQLQLITTAHNQCLPKSRSIPNWATSIFSSAVIELVLIYESIISSDSVVRCLALRS
jgi:hypothetical protein